MINSKIGWAVEVLKSRWKKETRDDDDDDDDDEKERKREMTTRCRHGSKRFL